MDVIGLDAEDLTGVALADGPHIGMTVHRQLRASGRARCAEPEAWGFECRRVGGGVAPAGDDLTPEWSGRVAALARIDAHDRTQVRRTPGERCDQDGRFTGDDRAARAGIARDSDQIPRRE